MRKSSITRATMPRKSRQRLPASLAAKIGRQGDFDPEVAFIRADRQAAEAAQNLRDLIQRVYGDQAEQVKEQIRRQLADDASIPDADENSSLAQAIASLTAIAAFYNGIAAQIEAGSFKVKTRPTIYDMAREVVEARAASFPDETVTLWQGRAFRVYVYRYQDQIKMVAVNGDPRKAVSVQVGQLFSSSPWWRFNLARNDYDRWVQKARKLQ